MFINDKRNLNQRFSCFCLRQNKQLQKFNFTVNTFTKERGSVHVCKCVFPNICCAWEGKLSNSSSFWSRHSAPYWQTASLAQTHPHFSAGTSLLFVFLPHLYFIPVFCARRGELKKTCFRPLLQTSRLFNTSVFSGFASSRLDPRDVHLALI